jgi:hypothetical protein
MWAKATGQFYPERVDGSPIDQLAAGGRRGGCPLLLGGACAAYYWLTIGGLLG